MATDQEIIEQGAREKADLTRNVASHVPRGDEKTKPERIDPNALRKAMYQQHDQQQELQGDDAPAGDRPSEAQIQAMRDEAAGVHNIPDVQAVSKSAGQTDKGYVTLDTESGPITVAKVDIDREGGVANYMRRRATDAQLAQDRVDIDNLRRQLAESNRFRQEQQQAIPAGQAVPATSSARPAERSQGSGASDEELDRLSAQLAEQIYSGDETAASKAIREILKRSSAVGESLPTADIEARVRAEVARQQPAAHPSPTVNPVPVNPRYEAINAQINEMAAQEFEDVCRDEVARTATFAKFKQLVQLPQNKDRRAVDVARDACEWGRATFAPHPRAQIVERKRGLPSMTSAGGVTSSTTEDAEPTTSEVIQQMAARRNFGRQIH